MRRALGVLACMAALAGCGGASDEAIEGRVEDRIADLAEGAHPDSAFKALSLGTPRAKIIATLGEPLSEDRREASELYEAEHCLTYRADDPRGAVWVLCLENERLISRERE